MGTYALIFFSMIFCHIVDDYYLQGILAQLKQKSWWEKNAHPLYKNDYKVALLEHAFSWSFMVCLPISLFLFYTHNEQILQHIGWLICINTSIHYIVDDLKANQLKINLRTDQLLHAVQIFITWIIFIAITVTK